MSGRRGARIGLIQRSQTAAKNAVPAVCTAIVIGSSTCAICFGSVTTSTGPTAWRTILEGYIRKILAGMATDSQDVVAVLQVLTSALAAYGRPEGSSRDNGSVFTAAVYEGLLEELDITVCHIEQGKPWQNLIEAQFKVERRLADAHFEQSTTLAEIQERHAAFIETFNETPHWAHRKRPDKLRTPVTVLSWARGRELDPDHLARVVNLRGYVSVRRFYLYAERGLARRRVSGRLYDGQLQLAYRHTDLGPVRLSC